MFSGKVCFQECTIFPQQTAHALSPLRANFQSIFCFDGYGLTQDLSRNKRIGEFRTKTCISTRRPPFWKGNVTNPVPLTLLSCQIDGVGLFVRVLFWSKFFCSFDNLPILGYSFPLSYANPPFSVFKVPYGSNGNICFE